MTSSEIIKKLKDFFASRAYGEKPSTTLISPAFPVSFNLSGAHYDVNRIANYPNELGQDEQWFMLDRVLRHTDIEKVGDDHHLSFFEMFTNVVGSPAGRASKEMVINETAAILKDILGLEISRLRITVFGGGYVKNKEYPKDQETYDLWQKAGFSSENLIWVKGHKNFVYLIEDGEQAGPRCEIFYNIAPNNSAPKFLEIGTTVFETHKFSAKDGTLVPINNFIFGNAFGIERLVMVKQNLANVYDVDTLSPLKDVIKGRLERSMGEVFESDINIVADHIRGLMFAIMDGQVVDSSRRGVILKKLIRTLTSQVKLLYIESEMELYNDLAIKICELFKDRYPNIELARGATLEVLHQAREKGIFKPDSTHIGREHPGG